MNPQGFQGYSAKCTKLIRDYLNNHYLHTLTEGEAIRNSQGYSAVLKAATWTFLIKIVLKRTLLSEVKRRASISLLSLKEKKHVMTVHDKENMSDKTGLQILGIGNQGRL